MEASNSAQLGGETSAAGRGGALGLRGARSGVSYAREEKSMRRGYRPLGRKRHGRPHWGRPWDRCALARGPRRWRPKPPATRLRRLRLPTGSTRPRAVPAMRDAFAPSATRSCRRPRSRRRKRRFWDEPSYPPSNCSVHRRARAALALRPTPCGIDPRTWSSADRRIARLAAFVPARPFASPYVARAWRG